MSKEWFFSLCIICGQDTKIKTLCTKAFTLWGEVFQINFSLSDMLSLPFPVFSGATLASSLAYYLKSGKDPVIFSIHSVSDWMSELVGEWKDGRKESRQAEKEGGMENWSLDGGWDGGESQMQSWEENQTKKWGKRPLLKCLFCEKNKANCRTTHVKSPKNSFSVGRKRKWVIWPPNQKMGIL